MTTAFLPPETFVGWLLEDAVPAAHCASLIEELERRGFEPTGEHYPRAYRDNDRLVFDDPALAASLFASLRSRLPAELDADGARWQLAGLNPRFRACRYRNGEAFCIHRDGPHAPADDLRSRLTVQLYLDDVAAAHGGRTRFYADPRGALCWAAIAPRRGTAIVFDHRAWHDGEAVTGGVKHVLRTDAMYRRLAPPSPDGRSSIGSHRGYVWRALPCRDGSIASAGRDGTVRRWGPHPAVHDLGAGSVTALAESADGSLWCGTRAGVVAVIAPAGASASPAGTATERTGAPAPPAVAVIESAGVPALPTVAVTRVAEDVGAVLCAAASDDGRIVLATSRGTLLAFDRPGAPAWSVTAHRGWAWSVTALPGGAFASCGEDGRVAVTDRAGLSRTLTALAPPLRAIACLPSGELLVGDTTGLLHHLAPDGALLSRSRAHGAAITSVAIAPDGTWATGSEDGLVRRWRGAHLLSSASARDFVTSVSFDPLGRLLCAGYDGLIWLAHGSSRDPVPQAPEPC